MIYDRKNARSELGYPGDRSIELPEAPTSGL